MIKNKIKDSSEFVGKKVRLSIEDQDDAFECTIDVMEEDGILVHYYTEEDDCTSFCEEDDDGAELTTSYYPWSRIQEIVYRESEKY